MGMCMRPSHWEVPPTYTEVSLDQLIDDTATSLKPLARKMFEDKFEQFNYDWNKIPQEEEND
jgi:hypothetical protein